MNVHQSNPFSTRYVRPGAISFHFENDASVEELIAKLKQNRWLGEIIGPHGTGKSTLLECLKRPLEQAGRHIVHLKLTAESPSLSVSDLLGGVWRSQTLVIIDGYEQLKSLPRYLLALRGRLSRAGMLVTAHASAGFPPLYQTRANEQTLLRLVEDLQRGHLPLISSRDAAQALQAAKNNVRDALFHLYDLYESRKPARL